MSRLASSRNVQPRNDKNVGVNEIAYIFVVLSEIEWLLYLLSVLSFIGLQNGKYSDNFFIPFFAQTIENDNIDVNFKL